jgi:hypothetical protein
MQLPTTLRNIAPIRYMKQAIIMNQPTSPPFLTVIPRTGKKKPTYKLLDLKPLQAAITDN